APIARHQRSSTQLTSLLINNAGALGGPESTRLARRPIETAVAVCARTPAGPGSLGGTSGTSGAPDASGTTVAEQ
ncbi:hypothetical protein OQ721_23850, partial [Mycobacterium ulcerans]|nr:hypothetical protein [Mycobacterium ulcerans]